MPRDKNSRRKPAEALAAGSLPPDIGAGGAFVRMYRIGHGDCFLLGFPRKGGGRPVFVLIDCGYKPGSTKRILPVDPPKIDEIVDDLFAVTEGTLDLVIITHEHQDHLNAITKKRFERFKVKELWLAWTEDPQDKIANDLRAEFELRLQGLTSVRNALHASTVALALKASPDDPRLDSDKRQLELIEEMIALERGGDQEAFGATGDDDGGSNKAALKLMRDLCKRSGGDVRYLMPHDPPRRVPGAATARAFPLGPPRSLESLRLLDPQGAEDFHLAKGDLLGLFRASPDGPAADGSLSPFPPRYRLPLVEQDDPVLAHPFFARRYGISGSALVDDIREGVVPDGAAFRRIDTDWLQSGGALALDMNSYTNNTSLVLAFELTPGGKVLLFAGDAQRGNWLTWADKPFEDGTGRPVTAQELLGRTVLYKAGHHGSHNATLNGDSQSPHPCIGWMGSGDAAREFTAMITAVPAWAAGQKGWDHPYPPIRKALEEKTAGRLIQTSADSDGTEMPQPDPPFDPAVFGGRCARTRLYFDLRIDP